MRGKIMLGPSGRIAELVARGEAEMAVQQIPELLPVKGVQYVGPLPEELQLYTVFAAGIGSAANNPAAAKTFIEALVTPSAVALFKAKGLEPRAPLSGYAGRQGACFGAYFGVCFGAGDRYAAV